ncbi:MAG: hypothetical protein J6Q85_05800 [Clostridia bacterium]|nr:hypothetical protein [Clostridia bacterium]
MPIGKNSIKRVQNGGYSNVKTAAPDMQNSTVLSNPSPEVIKAFVTPKEEKNTKESKEKVAKKPNTTKKATETTKKTPTKETKKNAGESEGKQTKKITKAKSEKPKKTASPKAESGWEANVEGAADLGYVNLGRPLPTYLL